MANLSNVTYTGDGVTTIFVVPFGFLEEADITVTVDGVEVVNYSFNVSNDIVFDAAPTNGAVIYISRDSDVTQRVTTFVDGSELTEDSLNDGGDQSLFLHQETRDLITTINADNAAVVDRVDQNETDIATNASNITTNATNISTNATNIATNTSDIATNAADIAQNASDIEVANGTIIFTARVNEVGGVTKGDVVYISGSSGTRIDVSKAVNNDFTKTAAIAVATETIANNNEGKFQAMGRLEGLNTSAFSEGDVLFLDSTSGTMTNVHPSGINAVMEIGTVARSHASQGILFIHIEYWSQVKDYNGIARLTVVNVNSGNLAASTFTAINDSNRRVSLGITSSNYAGDKNALSLYNEGYGQTIFYNNGNQPFSFRAEVADTHTNAATEIAKIAADGTFSAVKMNIGASTEIDGVVDEDNMASNSATKLATQQSIKAYVDSKASATEDLSNKTFTDAITLEEQSSTPSTPASGDKKIYAKNDGKVYTLDDTGTEREVGAGGGGGLDVFYSETFDTTSSSDFTTGNNATFDNGGTLDGTLSDEEVSPIAGTRSIKYTMGASSTSDFIKSPAISLDSKQKSQVVGLNFYYTYDGADGDIRVVAYDDTNSEVLTSSLDTLRASSVPQRMSVSFPINSDTANLHWGLQVVTGNSGAILVIDDVEISTDPFRYKDSIDTQEISSSGGSRLNNGQVTNLGSLSSVGSQIVTQSASQIVALRSCTLNLSVQGQVGSAGARLAIYRNGTVVIESTGAYASTVITQGSVEIKLDVNDFVEIYAANCLGTISNISYKGVVTSNSEQIIAYNSRNAENSMVRLNTGNGHGSTNTKIRRFSNTVTSQGNAITYTDSVTDGASFTINEDGVYFISYSDVSDASADFIGISLNSSQLTTDIQSITASDRLIETILVPVNVGAISWSGKLDRGDIIRAHTNGGLMSDSGASFTISKIGVGDLLGVPAVRTAYIKDVKPSGTSGGTFTSGAWRTRDLNTIDGDSTFVSISSNQFTLESGEYLVESEALARGVRNHQTRIRNITDNVTEFSGLCQDASDDGANYNSNPSTLKGTITVTTPKTFELQHRCNTTASTWGFGLANSFGEDEVYAIIKIKKIR